MERTSLEGCALALYERLFVIHILEPHGDDALISCWPAIVQPSRTEKEPVEIVTLGRSRSSEGLTEWFPHVTTKYLDLYEVSIHIARGAFLKDYRRWKHENHQQVPAWEWQRQVTEQAAGELWKESYWILKDALLKEFSTYCQGDVVCGPVGLIHPYHILVSSVVQDLQVGVDVHYSECPYNDASWTHDLEVSSSFPKSLFEYPIALWSASEKEEIFKDVYPTEMILFRYSYQPIVFGTARLYAKSDPRF